MAGEARVVSSNSDLVKAVAELGEELGLKARKQYRVGQRLWGAERKIDVVLTHSETRKTLGIECRYQEKPGTVEEKIPSTIQDIAAWPMPGIVVFSGNGFSENMKAFLLSTGKAVELKDLRPWLDLFFGLPEDE